MFHVKQSGAYASCHHHADWRWRNWGRYGSIISMHKIARAMTALLSMVMVFAPLSASACDLSCWLQQSAPDCHAAGHSKEAGQSFMSASSAMDMSAEGEMSSHDPQENAAADYAMNAAAHHWMTPQMDLVRTSLEAIRTSGVRSSSGFDHSRNLSLCSHESCSQTSASASPPRVSGYQPACLYALDIARGNPAYFLTNPHRAAPRTSPPIIVAANLLTTLRI
jgi:hypothetical protein